MSVTNGGETETNPARAAAMSCPRMTVMLVDQAGDSTSRLPIANLLPEGPRGIKHALVQLPHRPSAAHVNSTVFSAGYELKQGKYSGAKSSNMMQDEEVPDPAHGMNLSVLGKRRRSATVQVLAVALCPIHSTASPSPTQPHQQQQQSLSAPRERRNPLWPQCFPIYCASSCNATPSGCSLCSSTHDLSGSALPLNARGILHVQEQIDQSYDDVEKQQSCIYSPKRRHEASALAAAACSTSYSNRRQLQERLTCPPAPSKPAAKPKKASLASYKKFFVPSNLAELPPAFQALFTTN